MITLRTPSRANLENGVRIRVAACRKRLRDSRTTPRSTNYKQPDKRSKNIVSVSDSIKAGAQSTFSDTRPGPQLIRAYGPMVLSENGDVEEAGRT
jgi:hypothetical protein